MAGFFYTMLLPNEWQALIAQSFQNREQIENAKFSEIACVLHKIRQNSLFIKVGGLLCPFILQTVREQWFTETHSKITQKSLFFAILYLPTLTLETKSPFNFLSLKKSLLIDDKHSHSGLFFRNKYNYHTIICPSESSLKWFWYSAWTESRLFYFFACNFIILCYITK